MRTSPAPMFFFCLCIRLKKLDQVFSSSQLACREVWNKAWLSTNGSDATLITLQGNSGCWNCRISWVLTVLQCSQNEGICRAARRKVVRTCTHVVQVMQLASSAVPHTRRCNDKRGLLTVGTAMGYMGYTPMALLPIDEECAQASPHCRPVESQQTVCRHLRAC